MPRTSPSFLFVAASFWLAAYGGAQGGCRDQSYVPAQPNNGLEITANQTVTQTFTVGVSGAMYRVDISAINHHRGLPITPLEVRIVATDPAGVPTGPTLATVTFQPAQVPASRGALTVDLSAAPIAVQSGQRLGLRLSSTAMPSGLTYAWWGEAPGNYAAGEVWLRDSTGPVGFDLSFETFVLSAAAFSNYGTGHPGTSGVPQLTASANPVLGTSIDVILGNSRGTSTPAALIAGFMQVSLPTPFGGRLLVDPLAAITLTLPAAGLRVPQAIPSNLDLCGVSAFFQLVVVDPGATVGLAFSRGLELRLGT
jgi:hypothetical protein